MQAPPIRKDGLQLDEKRKLHRAFWAVERVAWVTFALVLVLALAGLTGSGGPLSKVTVGFPAGEAEYPRVARWEASDELLVRFNSGAETRRLALDHSFFEYFEVEGVQPEPERTLTSHDGVVMEFSAQQSAPVKVIIYLRALHAGLVNYRIGLDDSMADASTMILP